MDPLKTNDLSSLTKEQHAYVVRATLEDTERRRLRSVIWERTATALVWACLSGAGYLIVELAKLLYKNLRQP